MPRAAEPKGDSFRLSGEAGALRERRSYPGGTASVRFNGHGLTFLHRLGTRR